VCVEGGDMRGKVVTCGSSSEALFDWGLCKRGMAHTL